MYKSFIAMAVLAVAQLLSPATAHAQVYKGESID